MEFHFEINPIFEYELIKPHKIKDMIISGKGQRIMRQNRRKYFTDEMVLLWHLLYTFLNKANMYRVKPIMTSRLCLSEI